MNNTHLQFIGQRELGMQLLKLSKAESNSVKRQAVRAASNVVRDEAKRRAPKKTGRLKRNIKTVTVNQRKRGRITAGVTVSGLNSAGTNSDNTMKANDPRNAFYARFLEFGTAKMAPHSFIRPAFDAKLGQAEQAAEQKLIQALDKVLSK